MVSEKSDLVKDKNNNTVKLKICGMKSNSLEVAALQPDYLGFIFWEPSKRYFEGATPTVPDGIQKIGVFVDATVEEVVDKIRTYDLQGVQLHGQESAAYCEELRASAVGHKVTIIKVFSIKGAFDFGQLQLFEAVCDYYLFDTKGKLPGGNGYAFDWSVLSNYPSTKPYFLSGGIGLEEVASLQAFLKRPEAQYCHAIDVNSRFESEPGLKEVEKLLEFKRVLEI